MITETEMRAKLREVCAELGRKNKKNGRRMWAEYHGFSEGYLDLLIAGKRDISKAVALALGYNRNVVFSACNTEKASA
jgi:hypothetical protein